MEKNIYFKNFDCTDSTSTITMLLEQFVSIFEKQVFLNGYINTKEKSIELFYEYNEPGTY